MRRALTVLLASLTATGLMSGCGSTSARPTVTKPPRTTAPSATAAGVSTGVITSATAPGVAAKLATAQRTHEYPGSRSRQSVVGGWRSAAQAVQVFATTYVNWNADTVAARLQALAAVSVGQARAAMSLAAAQTARDYELKRGGIANSGVVEAIAPVSGQHDQYAVVTRELTTATNTSAYRGLAPAWHVALATVTRVQAGLWVLSAWQPEN